MPTLWVAEEILEAGSQLASEQGIPETYLSSLPQDPKLDYITSAIAEHRDMQDPHGGYQQVLGIGAGCTRYYLQQALAAA